MITVRSVEALQPGEVIWDSRLKGFGCRRQLRGRTYVLKYRLHGRQQWFTLGQHGPLTPDQARKRAKQILGQVAFGKDPAAERGEARANVIHTVQAIANDFLRHAESRQRPSYFRATKRHLLKNWKPLHSVSIFHLTRRQVATRLAEIAKSHGEVQAFQARVALSMMFKWAAREGFEVANPVTGTNKPAKPKPRKRVLTDAELAVIWNASGDDDFGRIVRLLMLTLQRREEVGGLRREEIAEGLWTIPGDRTKNHREHALPLSDAAQGIISTALRATNRDFAFGNGPRKRGERQRGFSGWSRSKAALDQRITVRNWTLHDLRRTGATVLADRLGIAPHVVEAVLNHISGHKAGVAGIYNRARYIDPMREALARWAAHVKGITAS